MMKLIRLSESDSKFDEVVLTVRNISGKDFWRDYEIRDDIYKDQNVVHIVSKPLHIMTMLRPEYGGNDDFSESYIEGEMIFHLIASNDFFDVLAECPDDRFHSSFWMSTLSKLLCYRLNGTECRFTGKLNFKWTGTKRCIHVDRELTRRDLEIMNKHINDSIYRDNK